MTKIPHHELSLLISKHPDVKYDPKGHSEWLKGGCYHVCENYNFGLVLHWAIRNIDNKISSKVAHEMSGSDGLDY